MPAKGVVVSTTSKELLEENGFYAATIVIDGLTDAAGGEGVDVLIGIEGLAFSATDEYYLQDFSQGHHGGGEDSTVLSTLEISSYGQGTWSDSFNPATGYWTYEEGALAFYNGTDYDDTIEFNTHLTFEDKYGSDETYSGRTDIDQYIFFGGAGDDILVGDASADIVGLAVYEGNKNEYDIVYNAETKTAIVTHKTSDALGGTGVDTLKNIDKIEFNFNVNNHGSDGAANATMGGEGGSLADPNVVNLTATSESNRSEDGNVTGLLINGTQFNDDIRPDSGLFKNKLSGDDLFFGGGSQTVSPGYDFFDGGAGNDKLELSGIPSRYTVTLSDDGIWSFVDLLPRDKGGEGEIRAKNIEKVEFAGPFELEIDINDAGALNSAKLKLIGVETPLTEFSSRLSDGVLQTSEEKDMFALSPDASEHASSTSWAEILGTSVNFDGTAALAAIEGSDLASAGWIHDMQSGGPDYKNDAYSGVILIAADSGFWDDSADKWEDKTTYNFEVTGAGSDDLLVGGSGNDTFSGAPGDDIFDGKGEAAVENWFDRGNSGDAVVYDGIRDRYTISEITHDFSDGKGAVKAYQVIDEL
jgi:hypothetical protein